MTAEHRRPYRFAPLDRTGWIIGLSGAQCVLIAAGTFISGSLLGHQLPIGVAYVPFVVGVTAALTRWRGRFLHEHVTTALGWWATKVARLRKWRSSSADELPPFLGGYDIVDVEASSWMIQRDNAGIGVVVDRQHGRASATLPVRGSRFSLCESDEQVHLLDNWSDVLRAFAHEQSPVALVSWFERTTTGAKNRPVITAETNTELAEAYRQLVTAQWAAAVIHETLITVTVDARKCGGRSSIDRAISAVVEEMQLLSQRLQRAGWVPGMPLSAAETADAISRRLDCAPRGALNLAQLAGLEAANDPPTATCLERDHFVVGNSLHRSYWIAEWPRRDVFADWLEPVLLNTTCIRTFSVIAEPIPQRRSHARVERDATRLSTDEEQRTRAGFRIGADHKRNTQAVLDREAELVSGHVEFDFVGIITITADSYDDLRAACLDQEQLAAQSGIELVPVDTCHDIGLLCSLPIGQAPSRKWLS